MSQINEFSLIDLIQAVQRKVLAEPIPPDQHWLLLDMAANILQAASAGVGQPPALREMQEIRGQYHVKRALEVAAAGGHNILLVGPPGAGKNMLAQAFPSILPHSPVPPPFRTPNSNLKQTTFLGEIPFLGELTLAHGGVLFLKELASFESSLLAEVAEAVTTHVVAVNDSGTYPARFILIATMQPCPCGFYGDPIRECTCSVEDILSYSQRLRETIGACFDLHVEVPIGEDVMKQRPGESSVAIRQRVEVARALQQRRYMQATNLWVNADIQSVDDSALYCQVNSPAEKLLSAAYQQLHFTPRQSIQTLRLARTIADLAESEVIAGNHVAEAIQYRSRLGR